MIYMSCLPIILAICQYALPLESAFVNISVSHTNIAVNGSLEVTLLGADPNATSGRLSCYSIKRGGAAFDLAFYNFFTKGFLLESPMPRFYLGRVQIISHREFTISPMIFLDEKLGVQCKLTYYDITWTRKISQSSLVTIENVYAFPVISGNHVQGLFVAVEGMPTEMICSARSRPASSITWLADDGVIGIPKTPTVQVDGYYFITTGRYILSNPAETMDGKKVNCTARPVFGSAVTTVTTLRILSAASVKLIPNEKDSSPSYIVAINNSSVWLHWSYSYGGNTAERQYKHHVIEQKNTSKSTSVELAKRIGLNGTLTISSPISGRFSGRVGVNNQRSTFLVVHRLRYNDSGSSFSSTVTITVEGRFDVPVKLKPVVTIDVMGAPQFILMPPPSISVAENSNLEIKVQMDGQPKPSATFQWPHATSNDTTIPARRLYPYIYESTYKLDGIPASFCGRILNSKVKNSVGTSLAVATNVTVLLKLDFVAMLQAGKSCGGCVDVRWNKAESGSCSVKYEVKLKNASSLVKYTEVGYNTGGITKCDIPSNVNIIEVQLTASFKAVTKSFSAKVSEQPLPTTTKGKTCGGSKGLSTGAKTGIAIAVVGVVLINIGA